jgi:hypothetical protein
MTRRGKRCLLSFMSVTLETSHAEMSPLKSSAFSKAWGGEEEDREGGWGRVLSRSWRINYAIQLSTDPRFALKLSRL